MGRRKGRKPPLSTLERVRMHRRRKKLLQIQNQRIYHQFQIQSEENVSNASSNQIINNDELKNELRDWGNAYRVSKLAINRLLSILNSYGISLPKNYRTLQHTPVNIEINTVAGGNLWYNGLGNCLRNIFGTLSRDLDISLNFNIDGLPLFNSSKTTFWPVLGTITGKRHLEGIEFELEIFKNLNEKKKYIVVELPQVKPMVISVWCGDGKPDNVNDYLEPFVRELGELLRLGININNHLITIRVRCFICDSPARAFIKGTVNFNHTFGCQKCMAQGEWYQSSHRTSYHRIAVTNEERSRELRTDERFRNRFQPEHHLQNSILEDLPIDMVKGFPIADSLHLLDLGLMKRLEIENDLLRMTPSLKYLNFHKELDEMDGENKVEPKSFV